MIASNLTSNMIPGKDIDKAINSILVDASGNTLINENGDILRSNT